MKYNAVVITVSDTVFAGERPDVSGPALQDALSQSGLQVVNTEVAPDQQSAIEDVLKKFLGDPSVHLILTTGGTGFGPRDVTPEATRRLIERPAPGVSELLRQAGAAQTPLSWTSRGEAGIAQGKLIINLPGSPKAMAHSVETLKPILFHMLDLLTGAKPH